jgi:hypothetical protein
MRKDIMEVVSLAVVAVAALVCFTRINAAMPSETPYKPAPVVQAAPAPPAKAAKTPKPRKKTRAEIAAENAAFDRDLCKKGTLLAAQLGYISPSDYVDSCK